MASIEQWKLSRAWTIWDEARDPDGADEHIERTCTNLCQLKDGLELNGFLDTLIPSRSRVTLTMTPMSQRFHHCSVHLPVTARATAILSLRCSLPLSPTLSGGTADTD